MRNWMPVCALALSFVVSACGTTGAICIERETGAALCLNRIDDDCDDLADCDDPDCAGIGLCGPADGDRADDEMADIPVGGDPDATDGDADPEQSLDGDRYRDAGDADGDPDIEDDTGEAEGDGDALFDPDPPDGDGPGDADRIDLPVDGDEPDGDPDRDPEADPEPDPEPDVDPEPDPDPIDTTEETPWDEAYNDLDGLVGDSFRDSLRDLIDGHRSRGYDTAREIMFSILDNAGGRVRCVYSGEWVNTWDIPPSSVMNTEHTWPQSMGADSEPARSDLHHLFPTISGINSRRSNHPFGTVVSASYVCTEAHLDRGEEPCRLGGDSRGVTVFQPRSNHRGDAARAMFYFSVRYDLPIDQAQEAALRAWHLADPVSGQEQQRNDGIMEWQNNRNPFVDRPGFIDRIADF